MKCIAAALAAALLFLAAPALAQQGASNTPVGPLGIGGAIGGASIGGTPFTSSTPGATTQTSSATRFGQQINVKSDFGAAGNALSYNDGTITTGTNAFSSAKASFSAADVGKTIVVDYAGAAGAPLVTTIATDIDAHNITLTANASTTVPYLFVNYLLPSVAQSGAGSYAPNDTITLGGNSPVTPAVATVTHTKVVAAAIAAGGSGGVTNTGGASGSCTVTGTTGAGGVPFTLQVTLTSGAMTAVGSIVFSGQYTTNPTSLTNEPVGGGRNPGTVGACSGLSGGQVSLTMGVLNAIATTGGQYTTITGGYTQASTSGLGTGATFGGQTITAGQFVYGTDDTSAISSAITAAIAQNSIQPMCVYFPQSAYLISSSLPTFYSPSLSANGCVRGDGVHRTTIYATPALSGPVFSWSRNYDFTQGSINGPSLIFTGLGAGPRALSMMVVGDRTGSNTQQAFAMYDENEDAFFDDIDCQFMRGSCIQTGQLLHSTNAYLSESVFGTIHMNACGISTQPCFDMFSQGNGQGDNEIIVNTLNIYAPYGNGYQIHGTGVAPSFISCVSCRVEGTETNPAQVTGDLVVVGDLTSATTPNNINFGHLNLLDSYAGGAAFKTTGPATIDEPYQIKVVEGNIGGGLPLGRGMELDFIRLSEFHFNNIVTNDSNVFLGSATNVTGPLEIHGTGGSEELWNYSSAGGDASISSPLMRQGMMIPSASLASTALSRHNSTSWLGNTAGAGAVDWSSSKSAPFYGGLGQGAAIAGGALQQVLSTSSFGFIGGGTQNVVGGTLSAIPGGKGVTDRNNYGSMCYGSGFINAAGDSQFCNHVLRCSLAATNASTCIGTADGNVSSTINLANIPNNAVYALQLDCAMIDKTTPGNNAAWPVWTMLLSRGASVGTTALSTNTKPTPLTNGTMTGANIAAAADATNGGVTVTFTSPSSNAHVFDASCHVTEHQVQ